jgi:hypothetical protein
VKQIFFAAVLAFTVQAPSADDHKAWMNDASDAQEDFRDALAGKSGAKVAEAGVKLQELMTKTLNYWQARKAADGVKLTQECIAQAKAIQSSAKANQLKAAQAAFDKMTTTCNACHELHLEKR